MDDYQLIEFMDVLQERLRGDVPALDDVLDAVQQADYRRDAGSRLQLVFASVVFRQDARVPGNARELQRRIALAESTSGRPLNASMVSPRGGAMAWNMNEPAGESLGAEVDPKQAQSLRYLSLPAVAGGPDLEEGGVSADAVGAVPARGGAPTRFGAELARCTSVRNALELTKKRLPALKNNDVYRFLSAVGYPVAVPTADALRFAGYVGLVPSAESSRDFYLALLDRMARAAHTTVARVGALMQFYAESDTLPGAEAVCRARKPRCGTCPFTARCSYYMGQAEGNGSGETKAAEVTRRPVKEWAADERPRERMLAGERLSTSELLAIILRTGSGRLSAVELARELVHEFGTLHDLEKAAPLEIVERMRGKGIGPAKAVEICAAIELGRRVTQPAADTRVGLKQIGGSRDVFDLCRARYKTATQEEFLLLVMNIKNRLQKEIPVSLGTLNASLVHPRDVFRHALKESAAAVIFVHNHPSGDPSPSEEDILLTARLVDAGKLLGIQVLDHVIIGSHDWYSFADHGRIR